MAASLSHLEPCGGDIASMRGYRKDACNYCKPKWPSGYEPASVALKSSDLSPEHLQILVDRGWRRSGTYYYKPDTRQACCPPFTIRLNAKSFDARRDQRKAINKWNKYVLGQDYIYKASRLCRQSREEKRRTRDRFDLGESVHKSEYDHIKRPLDPQTKSPIEPAHRFEVTLEPDDFTREKYELFSTYQRVVHRDKYESSAGFKRFLCSGLGQREVVIHGRTKKLGSYHQCYRLDGKLIAIGILDLLPDIVSSVYLIYHEDVIDWQFGKLSAMREISLAVEQGYNHYYMGYYIHSCTKMRYKATFRPSYLLDPISYDWYPLDSDLLERLSARPFVSLHLDNKLNIPRSADAVSEVVRAASTDPNHALNRELIIGNVSYSRALDYVKGAGRDSQCNGDMLAETSAFEAGMPGIMTLEEVEDQIDLGSCLVKVGDRTVMFQDLVCWETEKASEPRTLKGMAAELAACIGPEMMRQSAVDLRG